MVMALINIVYLIKLKEIMKKIAVLMLSLLQLS